MEPFPPDLIAQIATKLFREGAHSQPVEPMQTMPSASGSMGSIRELLPTYNDDRVSARGVEHLDQNRAPHAFPAMSHATASVPQSAPLSVAHTVAPALPAAMASPSLSAPSALSPSDRSKSIPRRASSSSAEGLQRFVGGVRSQSAVGRDDCLGGEPNRIARSSNSEEIARAKAVVPSGFNIASVRNDFPILQQRVHGFPLAWLDNAATTQKPQMVIDAISHFYATDNSNIHRAAHSLAARATEAYEMSRQTVARFLGAPSEKDIVFVRGTTEAINLVANTYGARYLKKGDEIILSTVEHHANIVPWQMIAKRKGAVIRVIPINDRGEIIMDEYIRMLGPRTRMVSLTHASNSLGTILPVVEMTALAKRYNARVLIDGAQSVSHMPVDMKGMGCDFFVFSGHKIFAPTGIGVLYVTEELHDVLPPWQGGGNMIKNVTFEKTTYAEAPAKFEAGTPNIADAVGLKAALEYVERMGLPTSQLTSKP